MFRPGTLEGLEPGIREKAQQIVSQFKEQTERRAELLVYCTFRTPEEQAILYRKGRTIEQIEAKASELKVLGREDLAEILLKAAPQIDPKIVTNAGPGQSAHNYGEAFDAVPLVGGKPVWSLNDPLYRLYGRLSIEMGLDWAGRWKSFREGPHSQTKGFDWREAIKA